MHYSFTRSGLAASRFAYETESLSLSDEEADIVYGGKRSVVSDVKAFL